MAIGSLLRSGLLALAAMACCAAPAAADSPWERLLAKQFEAIAFTAEIGGAHRWGRLIRWTQPIRAQIYEGDAYWDEVAPVLDDIGRMTGLPIATPADFTNINLAIRIVPSGVYRDLAGRGIDEPCLTTVDSDTATGAIIRASVLIQSDDRHQRLHCIVEELTQAMGLMDDSTVFPKSVFNDRSLATRLTLEDKIMLAMLYDPRLKPNMSVGEAMRRAPEIIRDFRRRAAARARAAADITAAGDATTLSATTSSRTR